MAGWRAQGKFNIHRYGHEIIKSPNQAFHPFWYDLNHEDTQARYFVEKELFKDALDAVKLTVYAHLNGTHSPLLPDNDI